jgi:hypothetical protein
MVAITSSTMIAVKSERSHHWLNKSVSRRIETSLTLKPTPTCTVPRPPPAFGQERSPADVENRAYRGLPMLLNRAVI